MTRQSRQFEPHTRRVDNASSRTRFTLQCHECGTDDFIEGPRILPDDVVAKKFSQRGWVIGRNRSYDMCPLCVGVAPENKLATVFKVTKGAEPVPTPADLAAQASEGKQQEAAEKTHAALDHCSGRPRSRQEGMLHRQPESPLLAMMAHDIGEIRAILEIVSQQNNIRDQQLKKQTAIFQAQMKGYERHMAMFERLIAAQDRQTLLQEQLIRAIANIVPTLVRTSEGMTSGVTASVEKAMNNLALIVAQEAQARKQAMDEVGPEPTPVAPEATEDIALMPAVTTQTVEPVTTTEAPALTRRKASFSVTSYQDRKPDRFLTMVTMDRATWEAAGFTPDDRYPLSTSKAGWSLPVRSPQRLKPKRVGRTTVVLQVPAPGRTELQADLHPYRSRPDPGLTPNPQLT